MTDSTHNSSFDDATDDLLLIVVGAHLTAEAVHRPLAYGCKDRILKIQQTWRQQQDPPSMLLTPLVCTDLWYLNVVELLSRPTICIGPPEVNAATAYVAAKLPPVLVIDETLQIQLDPEFIDLRVCVWGINDQATAAAMQLFNDRHLDSYLRSTHDLPLEPA